jgi:hypothetical protein
MIEDQNDINLLVNDLKHPIDSSSYNCPLEPCLGLEFDEVKDACVYVTMLMQGKNVLALEKFILDYRRETSY